MKEEVELEVIETEPDIHEQVIEKMQKYAEQDIDYSDLVILLEPRHKEILGEQTMHAPSGEEYFIDAKVVQHWGELPESPMVIPKSGIRRIISEVL